MNFTPHQSMVLLAIILLIIIIAVIYEHTRQ